MRLTLEVELTGPGALLRGLAGGGSSWKQPPNAPPITSPNAAFLRGAPGQGTRPGEGNSRRALVPQFQCCLQAL